MSVATSRAKTFLSAFCARFRHNQRHNTDTVAEAIATVGMWWAGSMLLTLVAGVATVIALAGR